MSCTEKRDSVLCKKSLEINNEIECEVKKVVETRFEKLCAEKEHIIKGLEKKIKDLGNQIKIVKLKYGSYLKI